MSEIRERIEQPDGRSGEPACGSAVGIGLGRWRLHPDRCDDVERVVVGNRRPNGYRRLYSGESDAEHAWSIQFVDVGHHV
jgi:hypothetical protein